MSKINPQTIFYPVPGRSPQPIVGGVGLYDTTLATDYANAGIPDFSNDVFATHQSLFRRRPSVLIVSLLGAIASLTCFQEVWQQFSLGLGHPTSTAMHLSISPKIHLNSNRFIDRATENILEFSNLGPPSAQEISPAELFVAIDGAILLPRNKSTNACTQVLPQIYNTPYLVSTAGIIQNDKSNTMMRLFLRNILAAPLYEYNSMM
ncbi:hypothetical protein BDZ45DRAFT_733398 [Acephala macrosclerotiorum]|nr:hypothetical protein BDZ45DRAFT_733398 [Acephala macrosclerotiorum]